VVKRDVSDDVNTRRELPRNDEHIGREGIRLAWLGSEAIHRSHRQATELVISVVN
jgi:hypothetical protein